MNCERCDTGELYQFEASPGIRADVALPLVCRQCGQTSIGDIIIDLPDVLEEQAATLAEAAAIAGSDARKGIDAAGKDARIETYFANVYQRGYLDGFFRALAFYQHQAKEGRLVRLRELWAAGDDCWRVESHPGKGRLMTPEAYTEFEQLLTLSALPEKPNAQSPANKHPSNEKGTPPLSR